MSPVTGVGVAPPLSTTVKTWALDRPWMNAIASAAVMVPLLFESYLSTSPTPMLPGSGLAKVAVEPEMVSALPAPLATAPGVMPTNGTARVP